MDGISTLDCCCAPVIKLPHGEITPEMQCLIKRLGVLEGDFISSLKFNLNSSNSVQSAVETAQVCFQLAIGKAFFAQCFLRAS